MKICIFWELIIKQQKLYPEPFPEPCQTPNIEFFEKKVKSPEAALHSCSHKKVFWKYASNLLEPPLPKCDFNKVAWLKSHFGKGVLL